MDEEKDVYSVTLVIISDDLDLQFVTEQIGMEPNQSWLKGERKRSVNSDGTFSFYDSIHEWGGWKCFIPDENEHLELHEQLDWWCDRLRGKETVMAEMEAKGYWLEMNCFASGALGISPEIQRRLSDLRLNLTVNFP